MKKLVEEKHETHQEQATPLLPVQESVQISETKVEEKLTSVIAQKTDKKKAKKTVTISDSVEISEIESDTGLEELEEDFPQPTAARVTAPINEPVSVEQVQPEGRLGEITEKKPKTRRARTEKTETVEETATVSEVQVLKMLKTARHATEVEEILETINAREFGPGESPLRELAQIGFLLRQGVAVSQITGLYQADHFPALRSPEAQSALVQLVEREGHETLISQVREILINWMIKFF